MSRLHLHTFTLWVDALVQYKLSMAQVIEDWFKIDWASVDENSSLRICYIAP